MTRRKASPVLTLTPGRPTISSGCGRCCTQMSISSVPSAKRTASRRPSAGWVGMFAMTRQVEVIHRWVDGPDVLTWFELRTATAGPMAIVNWSHVEDGRITRDPGHVRPTPDAWLTSPLLQEDAWRPSY